MKTNLSRESLAIYAEISEEIVAMIKEIYRRFADEPRLDMAGEIESWDIKDDTLLIAWRSRVGRSHGTLPLPAECLYDNSLVERELKRRIGGSPAEIPLWTPLVQIVKATLLFGMKPGRYELPVMVSAFIGASTIGMGIVDIEVVSGSEEPRFLISGHPDLRGLRPLLAADIDASGTFVVSEYLRIHLFHSVDALPSPIEPETMSIDHISDLPFGEHTVWAKRVIGNRCLHNGTAKLVVIDQGLKLVLIEGSSIAAPRSQFGLMLEHFGVELYRLPEEE